jgi:hypothetical protein
MNNFRTLILILVSVIQISVMYTSRALESSKLIEFTSKVCQNNKPEKTAKMADLSKDLCLNKNEDLQDIDNTICRKEASLKNDSQPVIVSNKNDKKGIEKSYDNSDQTIKKGLLSQIVFSETLNADLY